MTALKSLSDNRDYPQFCIQASNDYKYFKNFRRNKIYNEILEHVTKEQGLEYLQIIKTESDIFAYFEDFKENDKYGNPRTYNYQEIGEFSPTTLRYIKILIDLKKSFKSLDNYSICEIGVGYGGQCRIINSYFKPSKYCLIDIRPALNLAQCYLDNFILNSVVSYKTMNELDRIESDLIISNYAFSELPRQIQDIYLKKVILNAKRGYITYNQITPPEYHSYQPNELVSIIPDSKIFPEEPLTHHNNCVIIWGER